MQKYAPIPMAAGPVSLHPRVLEAMQHDYGSSQIETDFIPFYSETANLLGQIMETGNEVVLMTGEGMLALWGGLKSCLKPGDKVLSVGTGVFGDGIGEMAESLGCQVTKVSFPYDSSINSQACLDKIEAAIKSSQPKMITAVHCETPSGTLNPLEGLAALKKQYNVPLLYVDAVASCGGAPVACDQLGIDLLLVGSQKCLSAPPSMSIVAVSPQAWDIMVDVNYQGYDAILPFKGIQHETRCPYTAYWHGIAALNAAARVILEEGKAAVYARHEAVAGQCRKGITGLGLKLFTAEDAVHSPTVTAIMIPEGVDWQRWRSLLREEGLVAAGSLGPMLGKVFRLGHMGTQAEPRLMEQALAAIGRALNRI